MIQRQRVLLTEASSLSARQTITALGKAGYHIDICASRHMCIGRFSRYVRRVYRVPKLSVSPAKYIQRIIEIVRQFEYTAIIPSHEETYLIAAHADKLAVYAPLAVAPFAAFQHLQGKVEAATFFAEHSIPQPHYAVNESDVVTWHTFPAYVKASHSTAGDGVCKVNNIDELTAAMARFGSSKGKLMIQAPAQGEAQCQVQAMYSSGELLAYHSTKLIATGVGGSQAGRESVYHPEIKQYLERIGTQLQWTGALSLDYFYGEQVGPEFIEANPRLTEPMNAYLSGMNFPDMLVRLARSKTIESAKPLAGIKSTSLLSILLGVAERATTRRAILATLWHAIVRSGIFRGSREDLTLFSDPPSLIPLGVVIMELLLDPRAYREIAASNVDDYMLTVDALRTVQ